MRNKVKIGYFGVSGLEFFHQIMRLKASFSNQMTFLMHIYELNHGNPKILLFI